MSRLRSTFATYCHYPSPPQWEALRAIVSTLAAMATGTCLAFPHLSALDPGVGKTQAVIHFLRTLLAPPDYRDVGVLICIPRFEQIASIVADACLAEEDFAVYSRDDTMNPLGRGKGQHRKARVLFYNPRHAGASRRPPSFVRSGQRLPLSRQNARCPRVGRSIGSRQAHYGLALVDQPPLPLSEG